jgi:sarcosine oxidase subunit delta
VKILICPLNGPRPVSEFAYGGEVRRMPDPDACSDAEWSAYVFNRSGSPGVKFEWWCHIASGFWFIVERDTARDLVVATHPAEAARARAGVVVGRVAEAAAGGAVTGGSTP